MGGDRNKQIRKIPRWRIALKLAAMHEFRDEYFGSRWHDWEERIKTGHKEEEKEITERYKNNTSSDPYFDDFIAEDHGNIYELTRHMYAALIVSMWSEMEYYLRSLVRACYTARGESKDLPRDIAAISKAIRSIAGIQIDKCKSYISIDAVRILSNAYKHSNGYYRPKAGKPHTHLRKSILRKWKIKEGEKIDYSKLPIEKIYSAFTAFCADVLKKTEAILKKNTVDD